MDRDARPLKKNSLLLTKQWLKRVARGGYRSYHGHRRRQRAAIHELPKEENPFLGWRAIRIAMDRKRSCAISSALSCVPRLSVNCHYVPDDHLC